MKGRRGDSGGSRVGEASSAPGGLGPGKRTLVESLAPPPVQRKAAGAAPSGDGAAHAAQRGVADSGSALPHLEQIQRSFGPRHDLSPVRAHVGGAAAEAADALGASAYATGGDVAFTRAPDLYTAAHEAAHVVQQRGGVALKGGIDAPGDAYERHADAVADLVVSGQSAAPLLGPGGGSATASAVQRQVNPTPTARRDRLALLGDGSPGKPGITLAEFQAYIAQQADWFTEATLDPADRFLLWEQANLLAEGPHIGAALGAVRLAELINALPADMIAVRAFAAGASTAAQTVRITQPPTKFDRIIKLGNAMADLVSFVPGPVLRVCITQPTLEKLVDEKLVDRLRQYYTTFTPTIENPAEQEPLLALLRGGIAPYMALVDWVHDLHVFTPATRNALVRNVGEKGRKLPVTLVLMSGLDWNAAFLQSTNLASVIAHPANLTLVVQGAKSLGAAASLVDKIADEYGQVPKGGGKARLRQVIIAGHGQADSVEQTTPGTGAATSDDKTVGYTQNDLHPTAPGDDSEKLIDKILSRMDPADARVVFAGCLVGSHDVPETPALANPATAAAEINKAIAAKPNLKDIVGQRMAALGIKGNVEAANASTTFDALTVDNTGKAKLRLDWDPDVAGTKAAYLKTGAEPEGVLRAALETWADSNLGPTWTTNEMRKHVAATAGSVDWWKSLTRTGLKLALPSSGDVDPAVIANLAHRVEPWLLTGWESSADPARLAASVKPAEAPVLFPVMLASDHNTDPHLPIVVQQAWMHVDSAHEAQFMTALGATSLKRVQLTPLLAASVIDPHLAALLTTADPAKPSRAQLVLALAIAVDRGTGMPAEVKTLLTNAAGNKTTAAFPAALHVPTLLDGASELGVLRSIGLAPGTSGANANADLDGDKTNESFIATAPRIATITGPAREIRAKPDPKAAVIGTLAPGKVVVAGAEADKTIQVVGTSGSFTAIDLEGKIGFVDGAIP